MIKMNLYYEGRLSYAKELLGDLSLNKDDFNQFMELALENLSVEHTNFHGSLDFFLTFNIPHREWYPPTFLSTPIGPRKGTVTITSYLEDPDANPENLERLLDTFVDVVDVSRKTSFFHTLLNLLSRQSHGKYEKRILEHICRFKTLPSFGLNRIIISERPPGHPNNIDGRGFQKRGYPNLYCENLDEGIMVRVHDLGRESEGSTFAQALSEVIPSAALIFFNDAEREKHDLQIISDGGWYVLHPETELKRITYYMQ